MGTAKPNATTDVLALLISQHDDVEALFARLENNTDDRRALFVELADKLAAHATIEEKIFYPAAMSKLTTDLLHESVEEHLEIKRLLADMIAMKADDEELDAKLIVLEENVTHHARDVEEGMLFPILRKEMTDDERAALGNECLAMFEELLPKHPSRTIPSETARAAPLPPV